VTERKFAATLMKLGDLRDSGLLTNVAHHCVDALIYHRGATTVTMTVVLVNYFAANA